MRLSTERDALLTGLDAVRGIVQSRTTIPILSNILLVATVDGRVTITATNLDIEATTTIAADVAVGGKITIPATIAADIVKRLSKGAVIHLEMVGHQMVVKSGRAKFNLGTLPATDWPEVKPAAGGVSFQIDPAVLTAALGKTKFAISTEETRYYLNGVYCHVADGLMTFVATDGHRLAKYVAAAPDGSQAIPGVIIPSLACSTFAGLAAGAKDPLQIEVSPQQVSVSDGVTLVRSKTIDGSFPDYARIIPRNNDKIAKADRALWADGVSRVATVATDRGRAVKCVFHDGALDLSVSSTDGGDAFDSIDADYDGTAIEIGFNSAYLQAGLGAFDGAGVSIALADGSSPALLTCDGNPELTIILMPMRV